jgi:hypothetical protein
MAVAPDAQRMTARTVTPIAALPRRSVRAKHRQYQSVPDPAKAQKNQRALQAIHKLASQ